MSANTVTRPDESGSSAKFFIGAIALIFVIGVAAIAVLASGRSTNAAESGIPIEDGVEQVASVTVDGTPLAALAQGGADPAIGEIAPTLTGTSFDGETITIAPDGRPKVVMFLAHWCPHCQREVPRVLDLIEEGQQPDSIDIYGVSTAVDQGRGNFPANRWLAREGWSLPIMRDSAANDALLAYGAGGFPYVVYLDGDNRVIGRSAGELSPEQIVANWEELAAGGGAS